MTAATALTELAVTWQNFWRGICESGLHDMLELELLNRADALADSWGRWGVRPLGLAAILV